MEEVGRACHAVHHPTLFNTRTRTLPFFVGTILFPLSTIVHCPTRGAIRRKYNISGNECEDCIVVWCCLCCALAQVFLVHPHSDSSFGSILFLLERQEHHQVCSPKSNLVVQHPTASASPIAPNTPAIAIAIVAPTPAPAPHAASAPPFAPPPPPVSRPPPFAPPPPFSPHFRDLPPN